MDEMFLGNRRSRGLPFRLASVSPLVVDDDDDDGDRYPVKAMFLSMPTTCSIACCPHLPAANKKKLEPG